ncbi:MAG: PfkB family carbohydrate kinase [Gemmatimonadaceae bacterium]
MSRELLVAGSIALDTIDGPFGTTQDELGGSALYFALAASLIMPVRMVAPVGRESAGLLRDVIGERPIDISRVTVLDAPTYRWRAQQEQSRNIDLGSRDSIYDLWEPSPPSGYAGWAFVGSMRPDRQSQLMASLASAELLAADAMLSYVRAQTPHAREVLRHAGWHFCNHEEFAALGGHDPEAFRREWNLDGLVIKAGPGGVTAYTARAAVHVPALRNEPVVDTTGAGDAAAAGILAHWVMAGGEATALQESLVWGVACASIAIADIGLRALRKATREDLDVRVAEVQKQMSRAR